MPETRIGEAVGEVGKREMCVCVCGRWVGGWVYVFVVWCGVLNYKLMLKSMC